MATSEHSFIREVRDRVRERGTRLGDRMALRELLERDDGGESGDEPPSDIKERMETLTQRMRRAVDELRRAMDE